MKDRRLGGASRRVSEIGFGGWAIGSDHFGPAYGPTNDDESVAAIRQALELGVTFFDTADIYGHGHSEALIGKVLETWPDRDRITVATKGGINFYRPGELPELDFTPYGIANSVEQSRLRLRQDALDLYLLMNPPLDILLDNDRVWETLSALRRAGKIQLYGVSISDPDEGIRLLKAGINIHAIEVTYNIFLQAAALDLFSLAQKSKVAIIAREPLANGFLAHRPKDRQYSPTDHRSTATEEYIDVVSEVYDRLTFLTQTHRTMAQASLRFILDHPVVTTVIPGMKTVAQVIENCAASDLAKLTDAERLRIHQAFFPEDE